MATVAWLICWGLKFHWEGEMPFLALAASPFRLDLGALKN